MAQVDTKTGEVVEHEWERRPDVEKVIDDLIAKVHRHLNDANFIAIGRPGCAKKYGKEVWAATKLASPAEKILADDEVDYIVTVGLDVWSKLPDPMRVALMDHELSHCAGYDFEAEKWTLTLHDIEEFAGVLQRRGAWRADLVAFLEVAQKVELPQTTIEFPGERKA
jgi:putative metallopeptidase